ncbi:hypothetical protein [Streptomyces violaceusniger]|nr:hypothetical protein [Streptomyces violaceusniger]
MLAVSGFRETLRGLAVDLDRVGGQRKVHIESREIRGGLGSELGISFQL